MVEPNEMIDDPNDLANQGNPEPEDLGYEASPADAEVAEETEMSAQGYEPGDPEPEVEEEESEEKSKLPKLSIKTRINQINREKYQALEQAQRMYEENESLRRALQDREFQLQESAKAAMQFYDNTADLKLEKATRDYEAAVENGDVMAQSKAQREISALSAEIEQSKSWKAQQAYQEEQQRRYQQEYQRQAPQQQQQQEDVSQSARDWLTANPWFDERTKYYNPALAEEIQNFADDLDEHFYQNGMGYKIGNSPEYFNAINMRASELQRSSAAQSRRGEIPMRSSRTPVAPVRSNSGYVRQSAKSPGLSKSEQFWAKQFGVSEDAYRKERDFDISSGNRAYRSGYR